ncbi:hypothetical protein HMPREF1092_02955 [Clostridium thermobutyricum]|uniref:Uncharacterized protein n=1 Tax=Clostridium thermobutyricum TaxID=29372 RepID=N9WAA6_9CLOT|nr:hypothetical protein [Clostridium thermobutyricum]ENY99819.1 hypothetical protein HMPREF1092_02955 [Clostridium thermobutyricum]
MNKVGRKKLYSDLDLQRELENFLKNNPGERISISKLAKFTGIDRYYWYNRESIKRKIDELNNINYLEDIEKIKFSENEIDLPTPEEFVNENFGSKKKMLYAITYLFESIQEFYNSADENVKANKKIVSLKNKNEKSEKEIKRLKDKLKELEEQKEYYKKKYYESELYEIENIDDKIANNKLDKGKKLKDNLINIDEILGFK